MKTHKLISLALALMLLLSLCSCGKTAEAPKDEAATNTNNVTEQASEPVSEPETEAEPEAPAEITLTDMIGREMTLIPGSYQRVVCIGAGALRMYSYIGDAALLCGVEDIDNTSLDERPKMFDSVARPYVLVNEETYAPLPSCGVGGPNAQTAEAEKILACEPDIVISEYEDVEKAESLEAQLGVPVVTLKSGSKGVFDDAFAGSMTLLGAIFNREERAEELIAYIAAETEEISSRTKDIPEEDKPSVYICGLGNWGTTNHLMTSENYVSFAVANVRSAVSNIGTPGVFPIEEEKFVSLGDSMDMIIIDAAAVKNIKPLYAEDSKMFDSCKAWQNGEVYLQMAFNAYYTNYELALANTWFIAKTVYPSLFEDIDMNAKMDEITEMFLGEAIADEVFACPSSFGGYQQIDTESFFN